MLDPPHQLLQLGALRPRQQRERRAFDRGVADLDDPIGRRSRDQPDALRRLDLAGAGRTRRRGRTRRCRRTSMPYLSSTTCSPATLAPLAWASSLTSLSRKQTPVAASSVTCDSPSSKRPMSFIRPVRSSSLSRSTRPEPQMPFGRAVADHAERERAVLARLDRRDRAVERRHAAGDRAALERRAGRARRGEDAVAVAERSARCSCRCPSPRRGDPRARGRPRACTPRRRRRRGR